MKNKRNAMTLWRLCWLTNVVCLSLTVTTNAVAQAEKPKLFRAKNGLMGYKSYLGDVVVQPQFDKARSFAEGLAAVKKNGQWGFINYKGKYIVKPYYQKALSFRDGYAKVGYDNRWGVIDKSGQLTIPLNYTQLIFILGENHKPTRLAKVEKAGMFGLVDKITGKQLTPYQYKKVATRFISHRLKVQNKQNKYGFLNRNGQQIATCQYDEVTDFRPNGMALVRKSNKQFYIDNSGKYLRAYNKEKDAPVYVVVENPPDPKNGKVKMEEYIDENLKYPAQAMQKKVSGLVILQFVVERNGSLTNFKVLKGLGYGCDKEALRLLKASAPWKAGKQRGKPVRTRMTYVVNFRL